MRLMRTVAVTQLSDPVVAIVFYPGSLESLDCSSHPMFT
jgi:hypothetical protein